MSDPFRILVVCTANVCRSPVVERLLARRLAEAGVGATVTSAGTHGGRLRVHEDTIRAATRELGDDLGLAEHVSRLLTPALIDDDGADFVLTMAREHLRDVVALAPHAWTRSLTLKEVCRRALDVPPGAAELASWVGAVTAGRRAADMIAPSADDDLSDPYGGPYRGHAVMIAEVDDLTRRLVRLMPSRS